MSVYLVLCLISRDLRKVERKSVIIRHEIIKNQTNHYLFPFQGNYCL